MNIIILGLMKLNGHVLYLDGQELGSDSGKIRVYTNGTMVINPVSSADTGMDPLF